MELQFTGRISEIKPVRTGSGSKGEWANAEFEVTELHPQNENYPQVALFDFFKNGEYLDHAKLFAERNKIGDQVTVHFNFKKSTYQKKDGSGEGVFYKTTAWKIDKLGAAAGQQPPFEGIDTNDLNDDDEFSDLPF